MYSSIWSGSAKVMALSPDTTFFFHIPVLPTLSGRSTFAASIQQIAIRGILPDNGAIAAALWLSMYPSTLFARARVTTVLWLIFLHAKRYLSIGTLCFPCRPPLNCRPRLSSGQRPCASLCPAATGRFCTHVRLTPCVRSEPLRSRENAVRLRRNGGVPGELCDAGRFNTLPGRFKICSRTATAWQCRASQCGTDAFVTGPAALK